MPKTTISRFNSSKTAKISQNQRTLAQCWTKSTVKVKIENGADVIQISDDEAESVSSTSNSPSDRNNGQLFDVENESRPAVNPLSKPSSTPRFQGNYFNRRNVSRKCPFYKRIADSPYTVDAFNYAPDNGIRGYFLSHFHSDHYVGLGSRFSQPIYCSEVTAKLVRLKLKVAEKFVRILSSDSWTDLPDGTQVHLLNANHCPGAVLFVFRLRNGRTIIHTGDFRADDAVVRSVQNVLKNSPPVEALHLDTTYLDAAYRFPCQNDVVAEIVQRVQSELRQRQKSLIVVGAYQIGKERVFQALADAFNVKIYVQREKFNVLQCLDDEALKKRLTLDPGETFLHVVAMGSLGSEVLSEYLRGFAAKYDSILGIAPSGWEFGKHGGGWRVTRRGSATVIGAPYSEHSSFDELKRFVQAVRPRRVIPTVNVGNENSRNKMQQIITDWLNEKSTPEYHQQRKIGSFFRK